MPMVLVSAFPFWWWTITSRGGDQFAPCLKHSPICRSSVKRLMGWKQFKKAQTLKPDLVLLDIGLPQLNGLETENQLCQLVPNARVLFVSQNSDAEIVHAALSNGAQGYVLKADGGELLSAITAVIRGEEFVSSGIKLARPCSKRAHSHNISRSARRA